MKNIAVYVTAATKPILKNAINFKLHPSLWTNKINYVYPKKFNRIHKDLNLRKFLIFKWCMRIYEYTVISKKNTFDNSIISEHPKEKEIYPT